MPAECVSMNTRVIPTTAVKTQKTVSAHLSSEQILPFGFADQIIPGYSLQMDTISITF